ncbi:MAG: penicillin-binding protein 2 [Spirochaetes bacterium]|nr:penicillin-binding protein 2 [Spirochaetota bacterium]
MPENNSRRRIIFLKAFFVLVFVIYSTRLFSLQVFSGDYHRERALAISRRATIIPAHRGEIFDRNFDQPLVTNREAFAVSITPADVPRGMMGEVIETVSSILEIEPDEITRRLPSQYLALFHPVEIATNVSFSAVAALAERRSSLPGVTWHSRPIRYYVDSRSFSHILGYVGSITRDDLIALHNLGYQPGDIIGQAGVERYYDEILRGRRGLEVMTVDARGRRVSGRESVIHEVPEMGRNLVLTIDRNLQDLAEAALGPRVGSIVVLRPSTGEILAMVSYPWYDPNIFTTGRREDFLALVNHPHRPLLNRAIQSSFPPGSTFKMVMTAGILAENAFPRQQRILCQGQMTFGGRIWRCHPGARAQGHGLLNLFDALAQSCNIFYMVTGRDNLGIDNIIHYSRMFGLGELTGIDLPGETAGFIPTPAWKQARFHENWHHGDTMNLSIGQGFMLTTPLQMANMVAMTVNDGVIYRPHVLREVRDPITGALEMRTQPEVLHQSYLPATTWQNIRADMRGVVTTGTPRWPMNQPHVQIAGKTGTSEVGLDDRFHAWFAGFAPYNTDNNDERIAVSVIVEAANDWEWWAVFASAVVFHGYFTGQNFEQSVRTMGLQWRFDQAAAFLAARRQQ